MMAPHQKLKNSMLFQILETKNMKERFDPQYKIYINKTSTSELQEKQLSPDKILKSKSYDLSTEW